MTLTNLLKNLAQVMTVRHYKKDGPLPTFLKVGSSHNGKTLQKKWRLPNFSKLAQLWTPDLLFDIWPITYCPMYDLQFDQQVDLRLEIQSSKLEDKLLLSKLQIDLFAIQNNLTNSDYTKLRSHKSPHR